MKNYPFTHADLVAMARNAGHSFHEQPKLVIVLRNEEDPGEWNDWIVGVSLDGFMAIQGTADPGKSVMLRQGTGRFTTHKDGASRIQYGYYKSMWSASYHNWKPNHPCLRQMHAVPIERYDDEEEVWKDAGTNVGSYNLHRAAWSKRARSVGNYSHGCIVAWDRVEHWNLLVWLGYPKDGPTSTAHKARRWSALIAQLQC